MTTDVDPRTYGLTGAALRALADGHYPPGDPRRARPRDPAMAGMVRSRLRALADAVDAADGDRRAAAEVDRVAAIAASTGMPREIVARIRRRLGAAWSPASVDAYMADRWPFERADLADPAVRL